MFFFFQETGVEVEWCKMKGCGDEMAFEGKVRDAIEKEGLYLEKKQLKKRT
jgi:hypothetical protein